MAEQVRLRDGTVAWVLPLLPSDRDQLVEGFEQLSLEARRQRFLAPVSHLSEAMLQHLVDEVDGVDHVALVLAPEVAPGEFEPVAIGRMVRYGDVPSAADLAVTVRDEWHGRGVATALLEVLVRQRPAGVTHVLTEVASDNPASIAMLRRLGPTRLHDTGLGVYDVEVDLTGSGEPLPGTDDAAPRLHPALAAPWRPTLRSRDRICAWFTSERPPAEG